MSVAIGNIIDDKKTFIAGAPRSKNTGQVLLFQPTSDAMTIQPQHYLSGEQFGSGFGYDVAVSDFDSDGYVKQNQTFTYLCIAWIVLHDLKFEYSLVHYYSPQSYALRRILELL